jgi:hypothetical protein
VNDDPSDDKFENRRPTMFNLSHCFRSCLAKSHNRPDPWVS